MKLDLIRGCCGYRNVGTANFVTFTVLSFGCVCPQPDVFVGFPIIMVGSRSRRGPCQHRQVGATSRWHDERQPRYQLTTLHVLHISRKFQPLQIRQGSRNRACMSADSSSTYHVD